MDVELLAGLRLFEGLTTDERQELAERFQEMEILQGAGLAKEGDFAYKFFVVLDGEVDVLRDFDLVARLGPGDFFGEMALVSGERRNARVVAHSRCRLAWMMAWDFDALREQFPSVAARIDEVVAARMSRVEDNG